jgi:hypothetical protein
MVEIVLTETEANNLNKKTLEKFKNYRDIVTCLSADVPIECLCLPDKVQKILNKNGFFRVYDLLNLDFTKIEGISKAAVGDLASRLNEFVSMSV